MTGLYKKKSMLKGFLSLLCACCMTGFLIAAEYEMLDEGLEIQPGADTLLVCEGTSIILTAIGSDSITWSPADDFSDPMAAVTELTPSGSQWYFLTGVVDDSTCVDSVFIEVVNPTFEIVPDSPAPHCQNESLPVQLVASHPISEINWTPDDGVSDESSLSPVLDPSATTVYTVSVMIGNCELRDTITVPVIPFEFQLAGTTEDTVFLCLGDSIDLRTTVLPADAEITWSTEDTNFVVLPPFTSGLAKPEISTLYTVTAVSGPCSETLEILVRVDSLPDIELIVTPEKDPYCAGEIITIFAEHASLLKYPDIEFMWFPTGDGQIQDSTNTANVGIILQDTTTFQRLVRNNACIDTSEVTVNVIPPQVPLSVEDTTLCPGDMFQVEVLDETVEDIEWSPAQGLSCIECPDPIVTVTTAITYMMMGMKEGCPVGADLNVQVFPDLTIPVTPNVNAACPGEMLEFLIDDSGITNLQVSVSSGSVSCDDCTNPIVTVGPDGGQLIVTGDPISEEFCSARGSAVITILPQASETLPAVVACSNEATFLDLSSLQANYDILSVSITTSNGTLSCNDCLTPTLTTTEAATVVINADINDATFCGVLASIPVLIGNDNDVVEFMHEPIPVAQGDLATVTVNVIPAPPVGTVFNWNVNGQDLTELSGIEEAVPVNEQNNIVTVSFINSVGCLQSAQYQIQTVPPSYDIPNAFTPGGMENNMFRVIIMGNIALEEFLIFNRWGEKVYEGTNDNGWDGMQDGQPAASDVYVYFAKLRLPSGELVEEKGDVTLLR